MFRLSVRLFGKLELLLHDQPVDTLSTAKAQELLSYLLLRRDRPVARESLAALLWGDVPTSQSRKYLRQAIWQLQTALKCHVEPADNRFLAIDAKWVQINPDADIWLDVAVLERAHAAARETPPEHLDAETVALLQAAVDVYQGDLLDGWYQDWCLQDRDRLQSIYLDILERLMAHSEAHGHYEAGLRFGAQSLRQDRARECTHQRLMRLHELAGDRAAALRQYDRCIIALDEELGVTPSEETAALYERLRGGRRLAAVEKRGPSRSSAKTSPLVNDVLGRLTHIEATLADLQRQVRTEIRTLETALGTALETALSSAERAGARVTLPAANL